MPPPSSPAPERLLHLVTRLKEVARVMESQFLDKQEIIRLLLISAIAGEHMILIGPPGTAKSALLRLFAHLIDARYFEYLLTRFTEPNELFGPVDIRAFREGTYKRRTEHMLPEAEIVFLDEIFRSNSAILNSLLTLLNERRYRSGSQDLAVPLISLFGASNEVPNDDNLAAIFDRFLLRVVSNNLDSYHFYNLVSLGLRHELSQLAGEPGPRPLLSAQDLLEVRQHARGVRFSEDFLSQYKGLIFQIRSEGISVSDRRVVKLLKLFWASAVADGRAEPDDSDLFILKHIWNSLDQIDLLEEIVAPVVDRFYREHPERRRLGATQASLDDLLAELALIRDLLTSGKEPSDIQLFSQLRSLSEIRAALQTMDNETSRRMVAEIDALLENVFSSSKFG
jgi:MoxR-like ATPase